MPSTARHSGIVGAPPARVWSLLEDIEGWPRWLQAPYANREVVVSGRPGRGCEFTMRGRLEARLFARVTTWEAGKRLAFEIYRSEYPSDRLFFGRAEISLELAPAGDESTRVTCEHRLWGKGVAGRAYAASVMRPLIKTNVQRWVDSMAARLS